MVTLKETQWNLDLSFFKGMEKQNDECGKMINPGNYTEVILKLQKAMWYHPVM